MCLFDVSTHFAGKKLWADPAVTGFVGAGGFPLRTGGVGANSIVALAKKKKNREAAASNLQRIASDDRPCGFQVQGLMCQSATHGDNIQVLNTSADPFIENVTQIFKDRSGQESVIQGLALRNKASKVSGDACPFKVAEKIRDKGNQASKVSGDPCAFKVAEQNRDQELLQTAAGSTLSTGRRTVSEADAADDACISPQGAGPMKDTVWWEGEMEWCVRAFLESVDDPAVLRSALDINRLSDACSHKANIGDRDEEAKDKAEEETEARYSDVNKAFREALNRVYNPLKIDVIKAVTRKISARAKQAGDSVQDRAHIKKLLDNVWEVKNKDCAGASAVDRALVRTGAGFRSVKGAERRVLVDSLAEQVLLSPDRPSHAEVRRPWAGTISHPKHLRLF